jgi:type VI secretion system protein ImpJ
MMEPIKPVFWYQGLFLQPQHFQQADLYGQSLSSPLKRYLQPFFWGACRMAVDEGALRERVFELSQGEFIFQDGSYVSLSENALLQPRSFKDFWVEMEKPLKVYLGLKKWDRNGNNVTVLAGDESYHALQSRFVSPEAAEEVKDLYQKEQTAQVKFLDYLLKVFWEGEPETTGDYHLIPIAVLEFDGQDVRLSKEFEPPTVTISSSEGLSRTLKNIFELVSSRCAILEEYKNPRGFQTGTMQAAYLTFFLAFRSLGRFLPLLRHTLDAPEVHPWHVYGLLRQFMGDLSSFSDRVDALGRLRNGTDLIPPYDHENLAFCFHQAQMLIEEVMSFILVGIENVVYLYKEGDYFRGQIPAAFLDPANTFFLVIRTSEKPQAVVEMTKHAIKVSCEEDMSLLIQRALPGLPLEYRAELPAGVPKKSDMVCFEIDRSNRFWENVLKTGNIYLYWSDAPDDAEAELLIIKL